jgi:hypothetical protein
MMTDKNLRVIIVGLPLFGERLASHLKTFDPTTEYIFLNTYYSKWDKLKAYFLIPRSDAVFSINGSLLSSGTFDRTLNSKVPLIMNWVGTDVLLAEEATKNGNFRKDYLEKSYHFCEVDWIKKELALLGIEAEIMNFASFDKSFELITPLSDKLTVLTYIPKARSDFYGIQLILDVAKVLPEIDFLIAGTQASDYMPLPDNVKALGWVENMDEVFDCAHVSIRIPEHDGLSNFILESLARGKQVIYKYEFDHCIKADSIEELRNALYSMNRIFEDGNWKVNSAGALFIRSEFNRKKILGNLTQKIREIISQKEH